MTSVNEYHHHLISSTHIENHIRNRNATPRDTHDVTLPGRRANHAKGKRESPHQPIRQASVSSIRAPSVTRHANTNCTPSPLYYAEHTSLCSPLDPSLAPRLARHLPAPLPAPAAATTAPRAPSNLPDPRTTSSTASVPTLLSTPLSLASSGASYRSSKYPVT